MKLLDNKFSIKTMKTAELTQLKQNTANGVTIIYLKDQQKWGIQFPEKKATFHASFNGVLRKLTENK